jgi:chromate transporter
MADVAAPTHDVSFRDAARFWIKLGFINFGGPTGQIAIMHDELVERKRWVSNARFLHALNYCMLLPGPEAQQLAIYVGWLLHKVRGGLVAGIAFVAPAFFLILGLSYAYVTYGDVAWVEAVFYGLSASVVGLVAAAVIRIGSKALRTPLMFAVAAAAFVSVFLLHVPFPLIVIAAGVLGLIGGRRRPPRRHTALPTTMTWRSPISGPRVCTRSSAFVAVSGSSSSGCWSGSSRCWSSRSGGGAGTRSRTRPGSSRRRRW